MRVKEMIRYCLACHLKFENLDCFVLCDRLNKGLPKDVCILILSTGEYVSLHGDHM